jgi:hypothetical protein
MLGNWVKETSTTSGTGNVTLAGAVTGYASFNTTFGTSPAYYFRYVIQDGNNWETGIGHLSASTTLVRDVIQQTYSGTTLTRYGTALSLSGGTSNVFIDLTADAADRIATSGQASTTSGVTCAGQGSNVGSNAPDANFLWCWPFNLSLTGVYSGICWYANASGGTKWRGGVYQVGTNGLPGVLLATTADITPATGQNNTSFSANVFLTRGMYYLGYIADGSNTFKAPTQYAYQPMGLMGQSTGGIPVTARHLSRGTITLPDPAGTDSNGTGETQVAPYWGLIRTA